MNRKSMFILVLILGINSSYGQDIQSTMKTLDSYVRAEEWQKTGELLYDCGKEWERKGDIDIANKYYVDAEYYLSQAETTSALYDTIHLLLCEYYKHIPSNNNNALRLHQQNEIEQIRKQIFTFHIILVLGIMLVVAIIISIWLFMRWQLQKREMILQEHRQELNAKREILLQRLHTKAQIFRDLHISSMNQDKLPTEAKPIQKLVRDIVKANTEPIKTIVDEFNEIYPGMEAMIKKQYPEMRNSDFETFVLLALRLTNEDICILLEITNRTIWNRRQRLKQILNLPHNIELENWVQEQAMDY